MMMALFPTLKGAARPITTPITTYHHIKHAPATSHKNQVNSLYSKLWCNARNELGWQDGGRRARCGTGRGECGDGGRDGGRGTRDGHGNTVAREGGGGATSAMMDVPTDESNLTDFMN